MQHDGCGGVSGRSAETQRGQRNSGSERERHLLEVWTWVSTEPELYPTCSPWMPSPAKVVMMLGKAIVRTSEQAAQSGGSHCVQGHYQPDL